MALRIAAGLFLRVFGFGCGWGSRLPLGSRSFFCSTFGARDGFPVEFAHYFANNGAAGGWNYRRARAVCV
jgi:hypothetical protein